MFNESKTINTSRQHVSTTNVEGNIVTNYIKLIIVIIVGIWLATGFAATPDGQSFSEQDWVKILAVAAFGNAAFSAIYYITKVDPKPFNAAIILPVFTLVVLATIALESPVIVFAGERITFVAKANESIQRKAQSKPKTQSIAGLSLVDSKHPFGITLGKQLPVGTHSRKSRDTGDSIIYEGITVPKPNPEYKVTNNYTSPPLYKVEVSKFTKAAYNISVIARSPKLACFRVKELYNLYKQKAGFSSKFANQKWQSRDNDIQSGELTDSKAVGKGSNISLSCSKTLGLPTMMLAITDKAARARHFEYLSKK